MMLCTSGQTILNAFYDTTLPPEVVEAVAANLTILKSPTVLRQIDGRLWCWKAAAIQQAAAPVHAPMYGTTLKLYVIYSPISKGLSDRPNFTNVRTKKAIRISGPGCLSGRPPMIFTPRPTAN